MSNCYLAMDVGGTNLIGGLVDEQGRVLERRKGPTLSSRGPDVVIEDMLGYLKELSAACPGGIRPRALALGVPGWINQAEGLLIQAPNIPGWKDIPLASAMSRALGMPARLENDTNLYTLGEWLFGIGRGLNNFMLITLGTGVGGGLILDGKLWNGSFASAVEIGHTLVDERGSLCGCGRRGCLETVASATAMARLGRQWLNEGRPSLYRGPAEALTTKIMFELAERGDSMSLHVFHEAGKALGLVAVGVCNLLGLEAIIVGGGAAGAFKYIRPSMWSIIAERLIVTYPERIKLLRGILGEDAPLAGASALLSGRY